MTRLTLVVCLLFVGVVRAQDVPKPAPYTEVETLRIENVALEREIVQRALSDWQVKVAKLKADLEASRPGWVWSPETGKWDAVTKK
jgi:hypothetical protein